MPARRPSAEDTLELILNFRRSLTDCTDERLSLNHDSRALPASLPCSCPPRTGWWCEAKVGFRNLLDIYSTEVRPHISGAMKLVPEFVLSGQHSGSCVDVHASSFCVWQLVYLQSYSGFNKVLGTLHLYLPMMVLCPRWSDHTSGEWMCRAPKQQHVNRRSGMMLACSKIVV